MKFKSLLFGLLMAVPALPSMAATPAPLQAVTPADSAAHAAAAVMGPLINRNLSQIQGLGVEIDRAAFIRALDTYLNGGDIGFDDRTGDAYIERRVRALHPRPADTVSVASQKAFVKKMAKTDGAITLPGGTVFMVITEGEGPMPKPGETVSARYTGRLSDGQVFDTTDGENPVDLPVSGVVPGFGEALRHTRPGGTYRFIIPADQAYGPEGIEGAIPGNAALDFTIEIVGVKSPEKK
ncbi:MAG: FKBP-type peptidyl-prolyl cis-trans isomerase [Muribaculaceae bacterium]